MEENLGKSRVKITNTTPFSRAWGHFEGKDIVWDDIEGTRITLEKIVRGFVVKCSVTVTETTKNCTF